MPQKKKNAPQTEKKKETEVAHYFNLYGHFSLIWYFCVLLAFIGFYGFLTLNSSFRKLASLMLLLSASLPAIIISGRLTEDMKTAQAMALSIMAMQVFITVIGLAVIKRTIPLKLFRIAEAKKNASKLPKPAQDGKTRD